MRALPCEDAPSSPARGRLAAQWWTGEPRRGRSRTSSARSGTRPKATWRARASASRTPGRTICSRATRSTRPRCSAREPSTADGGAGGLVIVRDLAVTTMCPHHLLPALRHRARRLPAGRPRSPGIGTIAHVVDALSRRLTLQERIGADVVALLAKELGARGALCRLSLTHACLVARGERKAGAVVETIAVAGTFAYASRRPRSRVRGARTGRWRLTLPASRPRRRHRRGRAASGARPRSRSPRRGLSVALLGNPGERLEQAAADARAPRRPLPAPSPATSPTTRRRRARRRARCWRRSASPAIVVNNAGIVQRGKLVHETRPEDWDRGHRRQPPRPLPDLARLPPRDARGGPRPLRPRRQHLGDARLARAPRRTPRPSGASSASPRASPRSCAARASQSVAVLPGSVDTDMLVGSGFEPRMSADDVAAMIVLAALDAPDALTGSAVEMFG